MIFIKFYVLFLVSLTSSAISPQLKSLTRIEPRIFGGKLVAAGQFPYLVSLRTNIYETVIHECGGAIISEKFILLAAHCINKNNPVNQYEVAVSAYNIKDGEVFKVKSFYQHEQFVSSILMNDIALAELVKPIKFTNTVQSIELNHNFIEDAMEGIVAGFDETVSKHNFLQIMYINIYIHQDQTHELKYIHLTTITNDDCKKRYRNKKVPIHETKTLCAASNVPGTGLNFF